MKIIQIALVFAFIFFLAACQKEENVINADGGNWDLLMANSQNQLAHYEMPGLELISSDILSDAGISISSPIENIVDFNNLYIFVPNEYKIIVLDKVELNEVATIDFSEKQFEPINITFANATDAYVIYKNTNTVSLIDITAWVPTRDIQLSGTPTDIASSGNQIFIPLQNINRLAIVDSRSKAVEAEIQTEPAPTFIDRVPIINTEQEPDRMMLTCLGNGKINEIANSSAVVSFVDVASRSITSTLQIDAIQAAGNDNKPIGAVVTDNKWGFVINENSFFQVDGLSESTVRFISSLSFTKIHYDSNENFLLALGETAGSKEIFICNPVSGVARDAIEVPQDINFIISY